MSIFFQSLRSGSSGNALALWDADTSLLFDLGVSTQRECASLLVEGGQDRGRPDAVFLSHAHGDHVNYASLRVLGKEAIPAYARRVVLEQVVARHAPAEWKQPPELRAVPKAGVQVGAFSVTLVDVPHAPGVPNVAFVVRHGPLTVVLVTDFNDARPVAPHLAGADFVFLESNHDLELLRRFYNPASLYHLNNPQAARLLRESAERARRAPRAVMLGHLSEDRNTPHLAVEEIRREFRRARTSLDFELTVAPRHAPSPLVRLDAPASRRARTLPRPQPVQGKLFD